MLKKISIFFFKFYFNFSFKMPISNFCEDCKKKHVEKGNEKFQIFFKNKIISLNLKFQIQVSDFVTVIGNI